MCQGSDIPVISELPLSSQFNLHHPACGSDFSLVSWPSVKQCQLRQQKGHNTRKRILLSVEIFFLLVPVPLDWHTEQPVEEASLGKPSCRFLRPCIWFPGHHPARAFFLSSSGHSPLPSSLR